VRRTDEAGGRRDANASAPVPGDWEVMAALLRADRAGRLDPAALAESDARLARAREALGRAAR
jgi:hypothetical protein